MKRKSDENLLKIILKESVVHVRKKEKHTVLADDDE